MKTKQWKKPRKPINSCVHSLWDRSPRFAFARVYVFVPIWSEKKKYKLEIPFGSEFVFVGNGFSFFFFSCYTRISHHLPWSMKTKGFRDTFTVDFLQESKNCFVDKFHELVKTPAKIHISFALAI